MSVRTYTLFLPDITEEDLVPDGNEFEFIQDYEDYENLTKISDHGSAENIFSDEYDMSGSNESESEFFIPEVPSPTTTYDNIFAPDSMENQMPANVNYEEIPTYYSGKDSWIKSTNILCISCSNKIQGMPMFIPLSWHSRVVTKKIDPENEFNASELDPLNNYQSNEIHVEQKVMKVHYLTCNERCAKRYINRVKDSKITDKWQCLHLLKELVQNLKGIRVNEIEEGLDKGIQMQYCGPNGVSVQKFREMNSSEGKYEKI